MLGKCLWKMYRKAGDEHDLAVQATRPSLDSVLAAFVKAIQTVPKPRDGRQEPILEPHYKLVSVVHKLVLMGALQPQAAADLLQQQPYAYSKGEAVVIKGPAEWEPFMLKSMKHLRNADKQHWHHRMVARVASILYDEEQPDYNQAVAARHEFRESIFTKTMHIQVWKPDAERAGRHCVYMERYVRYICKVLLVLNDKANMDSLAKRVRKKPHEFFQFPIVWNEVCTAYLRLIRRKAEIPPNMDEVFKGVPNEEFDMLSTRLADWIANPTIEHPALEALRDSLELKKLNASQMKPAPIDDLINDSFAVLYTQIGKELPGPDPSLARAQVDGESGSTPRPIGPMSLNNLVMDMGNGTQIPVPVTFAGSEPSRPRRVGVSRREVIRRAELAVARMPEAPRTVAPSSARPQAARSSMILGSNAAADLEDADTPNDHNDESAIQEAEESGQENELSNENGQADDAEDEAADGQEQDDLDEQLHAGGDNKEASESARGSLHDSADDESDLSDVPDMEDIDESRIFPDLVRPRVDNHDDDHEEGDDGSDEEEQEDEEQDEEGDEGGEGEEAEEEEEGEDGDEMET
jgi:hypothetical protein